MGKEKNLNERVNEVKPFAANRVDCLQKRENVAIPDASLFQEWPLFQVVGATVADRSCELQFVGQILATAL
ncbi:MAG: hypothetical protein U1F27_11705 [Turneriella sp.]